MGSETLALTNNPGEAAYLAFCQNQSIGLMQQARMMKVTILLATSQNELPPMVKAKLHEEFMAMMAMVEVRSA